MLEGDLKHCWCFYLSPVSTGETEFNDEDGLGGDDGVGRGVGRRTDDRVCAALPCYHGIKSRSQIHHLNTLNDSRTSGWGKLNLEKKNGRNSLFSVWLMLVSITG